MVEIGTLDIAQHLGDEEAREGNEDQTMSDANESPSDSSSSDVDSDSENDVSFKAKVEALESELNSNPSNYDAHGQYIKILRKQGDIEKLRSARESMSALFPLNPEMWREWANDETTIRTIAEILPAVEKLYERGVSDYLSVDLWCDYLNFLQKYDESIGECSMAGASKARNIFERALTAAGLHASEGHLIWEMYREYEEAVFLTIEETDSALKEKQIQRIRNLFHRQLSVPLSSHRATLLSYKAWEVKNGSSLDVNNSELDGLSSHVVSAYQRATEMLNARVSFEEKIAIKDVDSKKLQEYMTYLKFEHSYGDPARIQVLYERAIAEFPISSDLWLEYAQYLDKTFKTSRIVRDVYYRATRNCPWVGELWVRYLLSLERSHGSEEELSLVFERSLQCTFSNFDEYLNVFLTRVDGLRRRISSSVQVEKDTEYTVIKDVFQRASDYLSQHLKNTESLFRMYSYWARLELKLCNDLVAARGVWESLLKISGSMLEVWQGYIAMEIEMGYINEARSLYKRCYSKRFPGTGSEEICHSWVRFEREYGSLEYFDVAVQKVTPRLEELQLYALQQEGRNTHEAVDWRENPSRKNIREKRKSVSSSTEELPPLKFRKDEVKKFKAHGNFEDLAKNSVEAIEGVINADECASNKETTKASVGNNVTKDLPPKQLVSFDDKCTAFISNLSLEATEEDLRHLFGADGGVVDIRILIDKFTKKSRGLAYVDFSDDKHLAAALEKNKQTLLGKRLSILKSAPRQGRKKGVASPHKSEHGNADNPKGQGGKVDSKEDFNGGHLGSKRHADDIQLKGKNTFAVPRNVKTLGSSSNRDKSQSGVPKEQGDDTPKSNDEFRKMFLRS